MKTIATALLSTILFVTFAVTAFAGTCCNGGPCCNGGTCCMSHHKK